MEVIIKLQHVYQLFVMFSHINDLKIINGKYFSIYDYINIGKIIRQLIKLIYYKKSLSICFNNEKKIDIYVYV